MEPFDLFLFDFDGVLVDTERLHYKAYGQVVEKRGHKWEMDFLAYCRTAHLGSDALKETLYATYPELHLDFEAFYKEKKQAYFQLLTKEKLSLLPGVASLLTFLEKKNLRRCVVTHSNLEEIEQIRSRLPLLRSIPHWITRECYHHPKPDPECYRKAIELYGQKGDRIVGFEDSIRGWRALRQTPAQAILVCPSDHPLLPQALKEGAVHYPSMQEFQDRKLA